MFRGLACYLRAGHALNKSCTVHAYCVWPRCAIKGAPKVGFWAREGARARSRASYQMVWHTTCSWSDCDDTCILGVDVGMCVISNVLKMPTIILFFLSYVACLFCSLRYLLLYSGAETLGFHVHKVASHGCTAPVWYVLLSPSVMAH